MNSPCSHRDTCRFILTRIFNQFTEENSTIVLALITGLRTVFLFYTFCLIGPSVSFAVGGGGRLLRWQYVPGTNLIWSADMITPPCYSLEFIGTEILVNFNLFFSVKIQMDKLKKYIRSWRSFCVHLSHSFVFCFLFQCFFHEHSKFTNPNYGSNWYWWSECFLY